MNKQRLAPNILLSAAAVLMLLGAQQCFARDIEYNDTEVSVAVTPGEPTRISFPGLVQGGSRKKMSSLFIEEPQNEYIILTAAEGLPVAGEAVIVTLKDGRSFSLRIIPASEGNPRDAVVRIEDNRQPYGDEDEDEVSKRDKDFQRPPASTVSGLMREMVLVAEFGKASIPGYRVSDRHQGQVLLDDGAMRATVDKIFLGSNLWGYVINASNQLDQTQQINPATFRIDGTRAVSAQQWELAPRPLNVEQQTAGRHEAKVYVITKARN